jgi:integrase
MTDFLIPNRNGGKSQTNRINYMFQDIFNRQLGPSLLRHSYVTHHFGKVDLQNLDDTATAMGSENINTLLKYVDKDKAREEEFEKNDI